ncbi:MAG: type IV pilus assembly protein PilM, partial [Candidatus Omnitrophica bacterium]|nr:type IV pilus assembly protein PilM [Candidatus Omnitrophota bacterium]
MALSIGFGSTSLVVIDPGRHTLKVGVGTLGVKGKSAKIQSVYTVKTGLDPSASPEEVIERSGVLLQEVLKRHGLSAKQVSFAIPGRASFVRQLRIPKVSGDRLDRLIQYEARQQIPFPLEDIILDSHVFDTAGPELAVTLVAIRKNIVDQYCAMLKSAGLVPDTIDVTTLSLFNCFYPQLKAADEEVVAFVDIGASTTDIVVCRESHVEFIRSAPQAGDHLTKALADQLGVEWDEAEELKVTVGEIDPSIDRQTDPLAYGEDDQSARVKVFLSKSFDAISNEIRRTLDFYVSQPDGEPVEKVLLTGGTSQCPGIAEYLEQRLGTPCEVADVFQDTLVNVSELDSEPLAQTTGVLVGQCQKNIGDVPLRMNFLPSYIVRKKEFEKRRTWLLVEGILLGCFVFLSISAVRANIELYEQARQELDRHLARPTDGAGPKNDIATQIGTYMDNTRLLEDRFALFNEIDRTRGVISETLADVASNVPLGETWLTRVDADTTNLTMTVMGTDIKTLGPFKEQMDSAEHLLVPNITSQDLRSDNTVEFKVSAGIEKDPSPEQSV